MALPGVQVVKDPRCSFCGWRLREGEPGHEPHRLPEGHALKGHGMVCESCLGGRGASDEARAFMSAPLGGLVLVGEHVAEQWNRAGCRWSPGARTRRPGSGV